MRTLRKLSIAVGIFAMALGLVVILSACDDGDTGDSRKSESQVKSQGYDKMVKNQPADSMEYSPTRDTINFWIRTWDEKNKLSFVYLQNANGEAIGYYVLKGLPVSYCAMLTPPEQIRDKGDSGRTALLLQAPSMDGVFYANGGTLCSTYYGEDATTGNYIEYTVGMGINVLLFDQPVERAGFQNAEPLGYTDINDLEN